MSQEKELAIGNLLVCAGSNEIVKRVISLFDHTASRTANISALKSLNLDLLEPCAEFLNIELADAESQKLYTKDTLISRIVLEIRALLPAECSECNQTYATEFDSEHKPLFNCHMCYRGSHSCVAVTSLHDALSGASLTLLSGHVWLCKVCKEASVPYKPRKSKTHHDSFQSTGNVSNLANSRAEPPGENSHSSQPASTNLKAEELNSRLNQVVKDRVCDRYKRGKCPHGLKGNKEVDGQVCQFEHQKYCFKYCRNGNQKKLGCSKGSDCKFLHPVLCKFSVKKKLCTNSDCTFIHLKGTRRKEGQQPLVSRSKSAPPKTQPKPRESESGSDDFLELKRLVDTMHASFLRDIAEIRSSLLHAVPYPRQPGPVMPQYFHHPQFRPAQSQMLQNVQATPLVSC